MAQKRFKVVKLYAKKETTFATDPSADGSGYAFVKLVDGTFVPGMDVIERPGQTNDLTSQVHVMGCKSGKLALKFELKGSGTAASAAATAAELHEILLALMGTATVGTGSTVVFAGSTTTVVNVASGTGFSVGMLVNVDCGADGIQPRFVTVVNTNAITLDHALPSVPAQAAVFAASTMFTRANSAHVSMAFCAERDAVQYTFLGCKVDSAKISGVTPRGTAILDIAYSVTDWSVSAKGSLPAPTLAGITLAKAPVVKGSPFCVGGTEEVVYGFDFDFGAKFSFVEALNALGATQPDSANAGLELVESQPKGTVKAYFLASHLTDFIAATTRSLAFAARGTGVAWGIYVPVAQWTDVGIEDTQGMIGHNLPFMVRDNGTSPEFYLSVA